MTERRMVTVNVHSWDESFDAPATDFLRQLTGLLETVPEQFRNDVVLEFDRHGSDYDSSYGELSLYYQRPETDEEIRTRRQYDARRMTEAEARERSQLAVLKAKYEPR